PSWELFDAKEPAYQQSVLPPAVTAKVTEYEASPIGWERYAGPCGVVLGMRSFGMPAPMKSAWFKIENNVAFEWSCNDAGWSRAQRVPRNRNRLRHLARQHFSS